MIPRISEAGILSKIGAALTAVGCAAGAVGAPQAALIGVGIECVCILVDDIWVDPQGPVEQESSILAPPDWETIGIESVCLGTVFPSIELPGDENDSLIMAANDMFACCNTLINGIATGAPSHQVKRQAWMLSAAIRNVKYEYDKLGYDFAITQGELDSILADIAINGLPQAEIDLLTQAGWSPVDIQAMQAYVTSNDLNLAVPSVTMSELLEAGADAMEYGAERVPTSCPTGLIILITLLIAGAILIIWRKSSNPGPEQV